MDATRNLPTFPADITQLGRGKAQRAVLDYLHRLPAGGRTNLNDMSRYPTFRGMHFGSIMSAVAALVKRGIVNAQPDDYRGETLAVVPHTHA